VSEIRTIEDFIEVDIRIRIVLVSTGLFLAFNSDLVVSVRILEARVDNDSNFGG
jgi:hypothetical protein